MEVCEHSSLQPWVNPMLIPVMGQSYATQTSNQLDAGQVSSSQGGGRSRAQEPTLGHEASCQHSRSFKFMSLGR